MSPARASPRQPAPPPPPAAAAGWPRARRCRSGDRPQAARDCARLRRNRRPPPARKRIALRFGRPSPAGRTEKTCPSPSGQRSARHSPVAVRLKLVFEAAPAGAADVGLVVLYLPIFALIEKGIEHAAAELARNVVTSAVGADALSGFELAEGGTVDAEPRRPQQGNHAAIELDFSDIEGCDTAVLARRDLVLLA